VDRVREKKSTGGPRRGRTLAAAKGPIDYSDEPKLADEEVLRGLRYVRDKALIRLAEIMRVDDRQTGMGAYWQHFKDAQAQMFELMDRARRDELWGDIDPTQDDGRIIVHHTPLEDLDADEPDADTAE
jgi:hypothetical protein